MVEVKSYPAKNGDAFLLRASVSRFAMAIDGGFAETFHSYIKSDLETLAASDYALDLVVVTHIDADHIAGLLSFFRANGSAAEKTIIPVKEVLYNGLRSLAPQTLEKPVMRPDDLALLKEIRLQGYPLPEVCSFDQEISARQGNSLSQLLRDGGYQWNTQTGAIPIGGEGLIEYNLPQDYRPKHRTVESFGAVVDFGNP